MFVVLLFGDGGLIVVSHTRKIYAGTINRKKRKRKKKKWKNTKMKKMMIMRMMMKKKKKKKKKKKDEEEIYETVTVMRSLPVCDEADGGVEI